MLSIVEVICLVSMPASLFMSNIFTAPSFALEGESEIEQMRLAVPTTDDPTLPALTCRVWILGITGCIILSFVTMLTTFRQNPVNIPEFSVIMLCYSLGKLMAAVLPAKVVRVPGTKIVFSLNPGPFSIKEHILCCMIANNGLGASPAIDILAVTKAYFRRSIHPVAVILLLFTTSVSTRSSPNFLNHIL